MRANLVRNFKTFLKSSGDPEEETEAASWRRGRRRVAVGTRLVTVLIPSTSLSTGESVCVCVSHYRTRELISYQKPLITGTSSL